MLDIKTNYCKKLEGERVEVFLCIDGNLRIEYNKGVVQITLLMPANIRKVSIRGAGKVMRTYIEKVADTANELENLGFSDTDIKKVIDLSKI